MYLLTNTQRKCFALSPVQNDWVLTKLAASKYDTYSTYVYITPDNRVAKIIVEGEEVYREHDVNEYLSPDHAFILPKTAKGKPTKLTAASIATKTPVGMELTFANKSIYIYSNTRQCHYYNSIYAGVKLNGKTEFFEWIDKWCAETGDKELADIEAFANTLKHHVKYKEGDFFRVRLDRHNFGYGRIILNYDSFRKKKIPFGDIFMGKPILAGIYHIITEDKDINIEQLDKLKMLPPHMIMDNTFFYGECEIIGNLPVDERNIDFPIQYGESISYRNKDVMYQCGRTFLIRDDIEPLFNIFRNNAIGFFFRVSLPVLRECIKEKSNVPYWEQSSMLDQCDLRNPKYKEELRQIREQFDLC